MKNVFKIAMITAVMTLVACTNEAEVQEAVPVTPVTEQPAVPVTPVTEQATDEQATDEQATDTAVIAPVDEAKQ